MDANLFELETWWKCVPIHASFAIGTLPEPAVLVNFDCAQEELANLFDKTPLVIFKTNYINLQFRSD